MQLRNEFKDPHLLTQNVNHCKAIVERESDDETTERKCRETVRKGCSDSTGEAEHVREY